MDHAFSGCRDLKDVYIPVSLTQIGENAFAGSSLETISFTYTKTPISIGEGAFKKCDRLSTVTINRRLNQISNYLFMSCPNLTSVHFNGIITESDKLGACAFANCVNLRNAYIPDAIKVVRKGAFANCYNLQYVGFPNGITSIEDYAFAECHELPEVIIRRPTLQHIGEGAFLNCSTLTSFTIPEAITEVKDFTFYGCSNLAHLYFYNITSYGERAFAGCYSLSEIDLSKATDIGEGAFLCGKVSCIIWGPNALTDTTFLHISNRYEEINKNQGSLKQITLGSDLTQINNLTFAGHVPDTITCMAPAPPVYTKTDGDEYMFSNDAHDTTVLRVPQVLVDAYRNAYGWQRFINIEGIAIAGNGDANGDGQVSIIDVTALIDTLLGSDEGAFNPINADVNGDGQISITDVTALIDALLTQE